MVWVPTLNELVCNEAAPLATDELPSVVAPSEKVIVPVTVLGDATVADRVTPLPLAAFTDEDESDVVVLAFVMLWPPLPDPQPTARLTMQRTASVPATFIRRRVLGTPSRKTLATRLRPLRVHQPAGCMRAATRLIGEGAVVIRVTVVVPAPVTELGEKEQVTPGGRVPQENVTLESN